MTTIARCILALGLVLAAAAWTPVGTADHDEDCVTDEDLLVDFAGLYVHQDGWIYQESNDLEGLQRGGENSDLGEALGLAGDRFGACEHPDTILF